ncbi:hypothetical protein V6N11_084326 [Hibiscus sabdariffa]|uniref:Glycine-rich RNA-binding protein RZ1A n=1 Tax=Hibiscus sabdariffa TaxID=183260 RepID=A0ABR2QSN5_9ROSI
MLAYSMTEDVEYRCFIGNLSWSTSDRGLKDAFEKFGNLIEAKVAVDKISGRSRGFGFVSFDEKAAMEEAIEAMNGMDLDGRNITVDRAKPQQGSGRDYDGDRNRDRGRGSNGGECFKCGKPGHFARECPSDGARGGKYGAGMQAVVVGLEVIDTVVIVLDHMSVVELELLVLDKTAACADEPEYLVRSIAHFGCPVFDILVNKQESSGMLGLFVIFMDTLLGYFVANWTWFYKL